MRHLILILHAATLFLVREAAAQVLMSGGAYSQNFDSLGTTSAGWTNNVTLPGWYASKAGADSTNFLAGAGTGATGGIYSFGTNGVNPASDRALGSLASAGNNYAYGVRFTNDTAFAQTNVSVSFTGEQWRNGGSGVAETDQFYYAVSSSPITNSFSSATWTSFSALNFTSRVTSASSGALDGNAAANRKFFANVVLTGVVVQPGREIFFRWYDTDDSGGDDGLAIDDLAISFSPAAPNTNTTPASAIFSNGVITYLTYNVNGNGATNDWSTNAAQVQAIGRELVYFNADIITFNEIPYTNTWQMANWVTAFMPGFYLATNSGTDGSIRSVIASRFPITRSQSWLNNSSLAPYGYTGTGFTRDLFEAQLAVPNWPLPLHVFVAHLKATDSSNPQDDADKRAAMASAVSNFFVNTFLPGTNGSHPYVLSGDMNESAFFPDSDYTSGHPIQRLTSAPTGLQYTDPVNPITHTDLTESIRGPLDTRFDYILPCSLLFSNIAASEVFRTDLLTNFPPNLFSNDDKIASDHLPVLMTFVNPFDTPFRLLSIARSNQNVALTWESQNNRSFNIEVSSNLADWTPLVTNILTTTTNSPFAFATNNVSDPVKFFRIHRVP